LSKEIFGVVVKGFDIGDLMLEEGLLAFIVAWYITLRRNS